MATGTVKFYNDMKGFGFIKEDEPSDNESFVHASRLGDVVIKEGDAVTYDIVPSETKEGKTDAKNVQLATGKVVQMNAADEDMDIAA
ncbi:MAG: cold shock domain-containing protein [candidate division SR1 bacterium]|nr:cold shock domain-containing protein [candidate division SR1 bacterium]